MKAFLDTSVLVATFYGDHEHHGPSLRLFAELKKQSGSTAAHCLAEAYAVMTGMPGKNRASPNEALLFIRDAFERLTIVTLDTDEYLTTLENAVAESVSQSRSPILARASVLFPMISGSLGSKP